MIFTNNLSPRYWEFPPMYDVIGKKRAFFTLELGPIFGPQNAVLQ
jgi:hypothetical protein